MEEKRSSSVPDQVQRRMHLDPHGPLVVLHLHGDHQRGPYPSEVAYRHRLVARHVSRNLDPGPTPSRLLLFDLYQTTCLRALAPYSLCCLNTSLLPLPDAMALSSGDLVSVTVFDHYLCLYRDHYVGHRDHLLEPRL